MVCVCGRVVWWVGAWSVRVRGGRDASDEETRVGLSVFAEGAQVASKEVALDARR